MQSINVLTAQDQNIPQSSLKGIEALEQSNSCPTSSYPSVYKTPPKKQEYPTVIHSQNSESQGKRQPKRKSAAATPKVPSPCKKPFNSRKVSQKADLNSS